MGRWERGISLIDAASARSPAHPGWYHTAPALNFYRQGQCGRGDPAIPPLRLIGLSNGLAATFDRQAARLDELELI